MTLYELLVLWLASMAGYMIGTFIAHYIMYKFRLFGY